MKVSFVQKVKAFAGSEKYFLSIIPQLNKRGITANLIIVINKTDLNSCNDYIGRLKNANIETKVIIAKSDKTIFSTLFALKNAINSFNPDIVHSHLIHADFWCAILKKRKKIKPLIFSTKHGYEESFLAKHGFDGSKITKNLYYKICKFSEKHIDQSFAVSEGLRQLFIDAKISRESSISTIHHGVKLTDERTIKVNQRKSNFQAIILGRVIPFKGHHYAIESFAEVVKKIPSAQCLIVGGIDKDYKQQLDEIIKSHNLEHNISFEGFQTEIYDYLLSSDIMLVPSISEGFGLIFLEGFNTELPIIGFDVAATNEIIDHQKNGILVEAYNTIQMAEHLIHLFENKEERNRLGIEGKKKLLHYFTLDRMTTETIKFYEKNYLSNITQARHS